MTAVATKLGFRRESYVSGDLSLEVCHHDFVNLLCGLKVHYLNLSLFFISPVVFL